MKKIIFFFSILLIFQSCNIDTEITYYEDKTASLSAGFDFGELITKLEGMKSTEDSTQTKENKKMGKLDSLPIVWTSIYDMKLKEKEDIPSEPDSVRLYKKTFIKRNVKEGNTVGFAFKFDRFSEEEFKSLAKNKKSSSPENNIAKQSNIGKWDGKKLIINTEKLNFDALKNNQFTQNKKVEKKKEKKDDDTTMKGFEKLEEFISMIKMNFSQTLKFENKIKSITGKHDWIQQIDEHTLEINYSTEQIGKEEDLQHKDKQIIVITE